MGADGYFNNWRTCSKLNRKKTWLTSSKRRRREQNDWWMGVQLKRKEKWWQSSKRRRREQHDWWIGWPRRKYSWAWRYWLSSKWHLPRRASTQLDWPCCSGRLSIMDDDNKFHEIYVSKKTTNGTIYRYILYTVYSIIIFTGVKKTTISAPFRYNEAKSLITYIILYYLTVWFLMIASIKISLETKFINIHNIFKEV